MADFFKTIQKLTHRRGAAEKDKLQLKHQKEKKLLFAGWEEKQEKQTNIL